MYRRIVMVTVAVAAIAFGVIAVSQAFPAGHGRVHRGAAVKAASAKARPKHHAAGMLLRRFAIFRSAKAAAASATPLPSGVAERFTEPGTEVAAFDLEPAETRSLNVDGTQVWITPGAKGLCVTLSEPSKPGEPGLLSSGCNSASLIASKGDLLVSREPSGSGFTLDGLVPDGDSVTITNQDGSNTTVPVTSNFFQYNGGAAAQSVSIHSSGGAAVDTQQLAE